MTHDYLIEIGLEDMPAHVVTPSINKLTGTQPRVGLRCWCTI